MRERSRRLVAAIGAVVGPDEILLVVALALVTWGLWPLVGRMALIAPGAVCLWIALPSRAAFLVRPAADDAAKRKKG